MSVWFNVVLSDDLYCEIDKVAVETESNKSEILRKVCNCFWLHVKAISAD